MWPAFYKRQKLMLPSCARRRARKWSKENPGNERTAWSCWDIGRPLVMKELPEAVGTCMLLTAWVVFNLGAGIQEWPRGSLKSPRDIFSFPKRSMALTNLPQKYRQTSEPTETGVGGKRESCDSNLPLSLSTSVSISSPASHILRHYFRGLYLDLSPSL